MSILTPIYGFIKSQIGDNIGKTIDEDLPANWDKVETLINTLDVQMIDYEEGTFTPKLNTTNLTYDKQDGFYTRIGNLVFIRIHLTLSALGLSDNTAVLIEGLPYTVVNAESEEARNDMIVLWGGISLPAGYTQITTPSRDGVSKLWCFKRGEGVSQNQLRYLDLTDSFTIRITGFYRI